jgi:HAD superfamily hydrolase (TIGR01509 family)
MRAMLFDLDGTLLDSVRSHYRVYQRVFADLQFRVDAAVVAQAYSPNWYIFYERLGLPKVQWPEADRLWLHYYAQEAPGPRDGAAQVLAALRTSGRAVGLVTSGERSRVERDLVRLGWERLFDVVVCGGDTTDRKPLPGPLLHALERVQRPAAEAAYVGDAIEDVQMGKAAGTATVAISGGFAPGDALHRAHPDLLVDNLHDLLRLL